MDRLHLFPRMPGRVIAGFLLRVLLLFWTFMVTFPIVWTIYSSLKTNKEFFKNPWALPIVWQFSNYSYAWKESNILHYFLNSIVVVFFSWILAVCMSSSTAYVFSRFHFRFRKTLLTVYTASMMVPGVLLLIPQFFMMNTLNLTNSLTGLIILYACISLPLPILLFIGFFNLIPRSLYEAAHMDGASEYYVFFKVAFPLIKSSIVVVSIRNILTFWNEYIIALTLLNDKGKYTVPIGIGYLSETIRYSNNYGALFAGLVFAILPPLLLYVAFQKYIREGMLLDSAVKG